MTQPLPCARARPLAPLPSHALALSLALLGALGLSACGGPRLRDRPLHGDVRVLAGPVHHVLLSRTPAGTVALRVDADGRLLDETRLPPESWATLQLGHRMLIDRVAGRLRGRSPGAAASAWSWPMTGKATAALIAGRDVIALDDSGRLCLLDDGDGRERDCVGLPDARARPVGLGRIHGAPWAWLRGAGGVFAVALGDRCEATCAPRNDGVRWSAALAADRPAPALVGDALWLEPDEGVVELRDGRTGALRASELRPRLGSVKAAGGTVFLVGERDDGERFVASLDVRAATLRWATPYASAGARPLIASGPGVIRVRSDGVETIFRARDGARLGSLPAPTAAAPDGDDAMANSAANEESWIGLHHDGAGVEAHGGAGAERVRWAEAARLRPSTADALPEAPSRPAWLRRGTVLHYLVVRDGQPSRRLSWTIERVTDDSLRLTLTPLVDQPQRRQQWDAGIVMGARELCVEARPETPSRAVCPQMLIGRIPMRQLSEGAGVSLAWPGAGPKVARLVGASLHAVMFRDGDADTTHLRHIPSWRVREAGASAQLEIAAWQALALVVQAERAGESIVLVAVSVPRR